MTTPRINVNPKPCNCGHAAWLAGHHNGMVKHSDTCSSATLLLRCPLPRSVTFMVRLGECKQVRCIGSARRDGHAHALDCPAHPVAVSCSISGKTWEESAVIEVDGDYASGAAFLTAQRACVERWALVKALVLGHGDAQWKTEATVRLVEQRDAVYAALADMARAEEAALAAQRLIATHFLQTRERVHMSNPEERPSAGYLQAFVERLIEQVGAL